MRFGQILDTSGKSAALLHHRTIRQTHTWPRNGALFSAILAENSSPQLKLHWLAAASDGLSRCRTARAAGARAQGDIDVNTVPDLDKATAIAATGRTKAAAAPRIKLSSHGFCLDHPDPELGEQLMADALGVTDRDAMHILKQLVKPVGWVEPAIPILRAVAMSELWGPAT